jgi:type I restriction enzyme S subunit
VSYPRFRLGDIANIERDGVNPKLTASGTRYVGLEHILSDGSIAEGDVEAHELGSAKFRFTAHHVLFGKLRPYLRKVARPKIGGICSTDIIPIAATERLDRNYLYHFLRTDEVIGRATTMSSGANLPRISPRHLANFEIPLPPLDEQRRIAAILDQADALRSKRQRAIDRLNELDQSVFLEMFGTPVKGERRWPLERFSDVTDTKLGKMLDRGKFKGWTHYRYLRNANVRWFGFDLSDLKTMEIGDSEMERFLVLPGDLIICEGGEPGRCAVWAGDDGGPIFYQKALHRCRVNSTKLMPEYLCHLLWNFAKSGLLADSVTSATIAHLTGEKLARLDIPIPPIDLQREFRQRVRGIQNLGDCQKQHIAYLDGLFGSLQQRAFTGQL